MKRGWSLNYYVLNAKIETICEGIGIILSTLYDIAIINIRYILFIDIKEEQ